VTDRRQGTSRRNHRGHALDFRALILAAILPWLAHCAAVERRPPAPTSAPEAVSARGWGPAQ